MIADIDTLDQQITDQQRVDHERLLARYPLKGTVSERAKEVADWADKRIIATGGR